MRPRRIADEPAFVLHRYAWSESSLILDTLTRHHGRVVLVAKGAKKPTSNFRPVLLPLQPLQVSYTVAAAPAGQEGGEVHPLRGAHWQGGHVLPGGDALLAGLYLNELLLRLLARGDPHISLFDLYAGVVRVLGSSTHVEALEPVLRAFELLLLRELGLLPALDSETLTLQPLHATRRYVLDAENGLCACSPGQRLGLPGAQWQALERALGQGGQTPSGAYPATVRAVMALAPTLKPQLRQVLQYHCGSPLLRTRQLMLELQTL